MSSQPQTIRDLLATGQVWIRGDAASVPARVPLAWGLAAFEGRVVELVGCVATDELVSSPDAEGSTVLTVVTSLVREAQQSRQPVVWITAVGTSFFPPDLATNGVDLATLAVVRIDAQVEHRLEHRLEYRHGADGLVMLRAADQLLRSGAFGLVVVDFAVDSDSSRRVTSRGCRPEAMSRLAELAKRHGTALVCLRGGSQSEFGGFVSLRAVCGRRRRSPGQFECTVDVVKDKWRGPGWQQVQECRGTMGLC